MYKYAMMALPLIAWTSPVGAADLYGYDAPPPVVERERIIERRYYPAPVYSAPVYSAPIYAPPRVYYDEPAYYDRPYRRVYGGGYPVGYYPHRFYGGRFYGPRRHW